jgi:hypothetical protein
MAAADTDALTTIVATITPFIGEHMARSATRAHCDKLGITNGQLTPEQAKALIARLESGLFVFIGREKASSVMNGLRQTLALPS